MGDPATAPEKTVQETLDQAVEGLQNLHKTNESLEAIKASLKVMEEQGQESLLTKIANNVSKADYVVTKDKFSTSTKMGEARRLGKKIIGEAELYKLIN